MRSSAVAIARSVATIITPTAIGTATHPIVLGRTAALPFIKMIPAAFVLAARVRATSFVGALAVERTAGVVEVVPSAALPENTTRPRIGIEPDDAPIWRHPF